MDGQNTSTWPPMADDPLPRWWWRPRPSGKNRRCGSRCARSRGEKTASARRIRRFLEMRRLALGNFPPAGRDKRQQAAVFTSRPG